jgi:hypothetical protein
MGCVVHRAGSRRYPIAFGQCHMCCTAALVYKLQLQKAEKIKSNQTQLQFSIWGLA